MPVVPSLENITHTDSGLASELRVSVAGLSRRLRAERDPDHELLPVGQLSVLGTLSRLGEITVGELAATERVQPPSMTRTVGCLVEAGYVLRRRAEHDGRRVVVGLAPLGREVLEADRRRREAWLAQRLRELTAEERSVLRRAAPLVARLAHA